MKLLGKLEKFFLEPASPLPLAALRIGLVGLLLAQAFLLRSSLGDFFSSRGMIQGPLAGYLAIPGSPRIAWLAGILSHWGISEAACLQVMAGTYLVALLFLGAGLHTRIASVATWFLHWTLVSSAYSTAYGVDIYTHVFLFYLMLVPCGNALSLDSHLDRWRNRPTWGARLGLRVMQLHLCISYLASAIEKGSGPQWWNGEVLWRALSLPVYRQYDFSWLIHFPLLLKVAGWTTLLAEAGYCVFIWPRATRRLWIALMVSLHLGIVFFLGLGLFGSVMCVLTLSIFGFSGEPAPARQPTLVVESELAWR